MSLDDRWAYSGPPPPTTESPARVSGGGEAGGSEHLLPGRAGDQCDERFRLWLEICTLAQDLLGFTQRLALTGAHRVAKPNGYGCACAVAGRLIRSARRRILKISDSWPWADAITEAHQRPTALATT